MMTSSDTDLYGHFSVVYSPDDEERTGKGFYAELWWNNKHSPLCRNSILARDWAKKHGGSIEHGSGG